MSLRGVIARHGRLYQYIRAGAGAYVDGRYQEAANQTPVPFTAVVQPVSGRQLEALPEGQSAEDTRTVYTTTELKTRTPSTAPDVVLYKGGAWRVIQVSEWEGGSGSPHYVVLIARQTDQGAPV